MIFMTVSPGMVNNQAVTYYIHIILILDHTVPLHQSRKSLHQLQPRIPEKSAQIAKL